MLKRCLRNTVAVQSHYRAESAPLEPPHQQLLESGILRISPGKASDIRSPPGNAGYSHVKACAELSAEGLPVAVDIARPHKSPVPLASRPGAAKKVHRRFHPGCDLAVVKGLRIKLRIDISHLGHRPHEIPVIVVVIGGELRLRLIQPEYLDSIIVVVFLAEFPHVIPGFRIGGVIEGVLPLKPHGDLHAPLVLDQETFLAHLLIILTGQIDLRPDGNHELHPVFLELVHHGFRIREIRRVKPEIAAFWPVIKVHHDHIHRNSSPVVFPRHRKELLLVPVAKLALPET